jgi:glycosyltransferase involved in cell wall biosynthesis
VSGPLHWIVPGRIDQVTGGYLYDRMIVEGLRARGHEVRVHELPGSYPLADGPTMRRAEAVAAGLPDGARVVIDGLALPGLAGIAAGALRRLRTVALVHHPLFLETGLTAAAAAVLRRVELDLLARMDRILCTSPCTAGVLRDLGLPADRIATVIPGTAPAGRPACRGTEAPDRALRLLCVATVTARKGHAVLVEALSRLGRTDWRLCCVGSLTRDPESVAGLRAAIDAAGLGGRIELAGEQPPESLGRHYREADLFVLASWYEGYGMAFAEALAHGLPVIGTTAGAIPSTVPADAGLLVAPGDAAALADAIATLLADRDRLAALRAGAVRAGAALPDWPTQAARFAAALEAP